MPSWAVGLSEMPDRPGLRTPESPDSRRYRLRAKPSGGMCVLAAKVFRRLVPEPLTAIAGQLVILAAARISKIETTEVFTMSRFLKVLGVMGMSSVCLMQLPCTQTGGGVSILPNVGGVIASTISTLTGGLI